VFRATDPNSEAPIALKLFDPTRCSTRGIRRYAELAAAAAAVPQSTATRLLEVQAAGPSPFAALELVPGQSLARMRQQEPILSWTVARALAARIAAGLAAVHQAGLVHAALKPTNIHIILGPSQRLHTRLLDFGAGALLEPEEVGVTRINDNPAVDYVSPEQLQGEQERPTADLYSLGVILYELVTGRRPFEGRVTDIVRQHLRTPARSPAYPGPWLAGGGRGADPRAAREVAASAPEHGRRARQPRAPPFGPRRCKHNRSRPPRAITTSPSPRSGSARITTGPPQRRPDPSPSTVRWPLRAQCAPR
jgi:serine/threonine protein kinase